jgi:alkanesulfonate monooxygenase SsuD/methylene tetrahydromethanopterin reductase-like flavin-dependent oxidoreductase (luciferase family)
MEFATLSRLAPGRFHAGIGHGVQEWMGQMGARPASPLTAFDETVRAVRALLNGKSVTISGRYVTLDHVELDVAPDPAPPVWAGVRGPKSMALAGRIADGTILVELSGPTAVTAARGAVGNTTHMITSFAAMSVAVDADDARAPLVPLIAERMATGEPALRLLPFYDELVRSARQSAWPEVVAAMPGDYWTHIGPIGTPDDAATFLNSMAAAGAQSVSVFPNPSDPITDLRWFADSVFPLLETP